GLTMREAIYAALKPVRARQQTLFVVRCVVGGLLVGAVAGLAVGLARLTVAPGTSWAVGAAMFLVGPLLRLLLGLTLRRGGDDAAAAVDTHYGLKDRAVTALAFADKPATSELHAIQINEALGRLSTVNANAVVPMKAPRAWPVAVVAMAIAAVAL